MSESETIIIEEHPTRAAIRTKPRHHHPHYAHRLRRKSTPKWVLTKARTARSSPYVSRPEVITLDDDDDLVEMDVLSATKLHHPHRRAHQHMHPYFVVNVNGKREYKSPTVRNTARPTWNEPFTVRLPAEHEPLTLEMRYRDRIGRSHVVGSKTFTRHEIERSNFNGQPLTLEFDQGGGNVQVAFRRFIPGGRVHPNHHMTVTSDVDSEDLQVIQLYGSQTRMNNRVRRMCVVQLLLTLFVTIVVALCIVFVTMAIIRQS